MRCSTGWCGKARVPVVSEHWTEMRIIATRLAAVNEGALSMLW
jgi:hypothetical protein